MRTRGDLYFPIRLRCADPTELLRSPGLGGAIERALRRSFARAQASLPAHRAVGHGVCINPACFEGPVMLAGDQQRNLLALVNAAIERAARAAAIPAASNATTSVQAVDNSEQFHADQYDAATASYLVPSYDTGKESLAIRRKDNPFAKVQKLYDPTMAELQALYIEGAEPKNLNKRRQTALEGVAKIIDLIRDDALATILILRIWRGEQDPAKLSEPDKKLLDRAAGDLLQDGKPDAKYIADSEKYLLHWQLLAPLIRARLSDLDKQVKLLSGPDPIGARTAILDVGTYYIEAVAMADEEAAERIAFLDAYYADRSRIVKYAIVRWAMDMYENSLKPNLPAKEIYFDVVLMDQIYMAVYQHATALELALWTSTGPVVAAVYGDLPKSRSELAREPDRSEMSSLIKQVFRLQVEVAIAYLVQAVDRLMWAANQISQKADKWWDELLRNKKELITEWNAGDHTAFMNGIQARGDRLEEIHKEIYKAIRNREILRKLGEHLPFLLIGGIAAAGIGAWVLEATAGDLLVSMFAEGAALTIFNGALTPAAQRPKGAIGWTIQFGENVFLIGMGRLFSVMLAPEVSLLGETLPSARRVAFAIAGTYIGNIALQSAVQALDAWARGMGGETSITQLLSMNAIMNLSGALLGSAVGPKEGSNITPEQFLRMSRVEQIQVLKNTWFINDDMAQRWLDLHDQLGAFDRSADRIAKAAQNKKLSESEFDNWQKEALETAKKLTDDLDLVEKVSGPQSRQDFATMLNRMTEAVKNLKYSDLVNPLPELAKGLTAVGDGHSYTYDPLTFPRSRVAKLRDYYRTHHPDAEITEPSRGGLEVRAKDGSLIFQALPANRGTIVPRSLESLATAGAPRDPVIPLDETAQGPKALEGLQRVRAQSHAPELEAQLAEAAQTQAAAVLKLLQILARGDATKYGEVWTGMSNYLKNGGSARTLARVLGLAGDADGRSAFGVLRQMWRWTSNEIAGLEAIYELRPNTTANEINVFLGDLGADGVRETLSDISAIAERSEQSGLRSVIGRLFTPFRPPVKYRAGQVAISPDQRGAVGALYAAVRLAERYPGMHIMFESATATPLGSIRIEDVALFDPTTGKRFRGFEVKEVTSEFLGKRSPLELAKDIALDYEQRELSKSAGVTAGPYNSFRWMVRRYEIEAKARKELADEGISKPTDEQVDTRMRHLVRISLQYAFYQSDFQALPGPVQTEYQNLFWGSLPFVEFF